MAATLTTSCSVSAHKVKLSNIDKTHHIIYDCGNIKDEIHQDIDYGVIFYNEEIIRNKLYDEKKTAELDNIEEAVRKNDMLRLQKLIVSDICKRKYGSYYVKQPNK